MSDLISRADAIGIIEDYIGKDYMTPMSRLYSVRSELSALPSADRSIGGRAFGSWQIDDDCVWCSECESVFELEEKAEEFDFCPVCGAQMICYDNFRMTKTWILHQIIKKFREQEEKAKDKPHGLKEPIVWDRAAKEVESWLNKKGMML